jgi:hypothetical protein
MLTKRRQRRERINANAFRRAIIHCNGRAYYARWYAGLRMLWGKRHSAWVATQWNAVRYPDFYRNQ